MWLSCAVSGSSLPAAFSRTWKYFWEHFTGHATFSIFLITEKFLSEQDKTNFQYKKKNIPLKEASLEQVSYNLGFSFNSIYSTSTQATLRGDHSMSWQAVTKWSLQQLIYKKLWLYSTHWAQVAGFSSRGCWVSCVRGGHALPCTGSSWS